MKKETKLTEKPTRIPDPHQTQWSKIIEQYLQEVEPLNNESARSLRFGMLVKELFSLEPGFIEFYVSGVEKYLKVKQCFPFGKVDRFLKGEADNLFGNVIIEFEGNIPKKRAEAEGQLRRYVAILWSQEPPDARTPYLCIATDGVRFVTYSPTLADATAKSPCPLLQRGNEVAPDDVRLQVLEETDWTKLEPHEVFYWLDRYFLRKETLHPTSETIVRDFGVKSHAFQTTTNALLTLWQEIKAQSAFAVIYDSWEKYLRIVYGSEVAGDELFVRHTYLATLAKLMSWMRITESTSLPDDAQIIEMLEGRSFKAQGIENFIEEDFFSWLARAEAVTSPPATPPNPPNLGGRGGLGVSVARWLFSLLQNYNLRELSEDVLKSLYQELVDPETRHDLGEFYTPDWLAHRIVRKLLDINPHGAMLDPACGSGTFLYLAIREKRERLGNSLETLRHILDSVYGADIHPLAVIVAKTNYILALGDLLKRRKGTVTIPVYLADTIRLPERELQPTLWMQLPSYRVELGGCEIHLPEFGSAGASPSRWLENLTLYDQAIELAKEFARQNKGRPIKLESFRNFLAAQRLLPLLPSSGGAGVGGEGRGEGDNASLVQALFAIAEVLKGFIDADRDTIWAFVLKNIYKPLFFKHKFDFVMGNPPWIAFRFMEPAYQAFLKRQITQEYKLLTGRGELITHLEVATLFLVRSADLYLKSGGTIAFVLPRSLFSADQHDGLRKRAFKFSEDTTQNLFWREIWECENVAPLFNVPACVLIADKREPAKMEYPVAGQILSGKLERKNASLVEAEGALSVEDVEFSLHTHGKRSFWATKNPKTGAFPKGTTLSEGEAEKTQARSYYKDKFANGATIVPRSFWFVQVKPSPLGFNPDLPPLETADRAREKAKDAYKSVFFKDTVESHFLYATLLSTDLLPFGYLDYRLVVLPIEPEGNHYKLIDADKARQLGYLHLARWLEKAEQEWNTRRGAKAERITALGWLDYRKKLTTQNPQANNEKTRSEPSYRVIYNTSGTYLTAAVVENEPIEFEINGQWVVACGFVADTKTYFCELSNSHEAYFLVAVLNAPVIDELIKPMQSRGLWGPRDICKKVLELPIPRFDATNPTHRRLAELGEACSAKVGQWLASGGAGKIKSIGKLRSMVREMLKEELEEIDGLVKEILG